MEKPYSEICTGVILAGGKNTRMNGKNKATLCISGHRLVDLAYEVMNAFFDEILIISNTPELYTDMDVPVMADVLDIKSALTGIHTGLFYATRPMAFFLSCDMPFINERLAREILEYAKSGHDVVVPETENGYEPLCALYSKKCIKPVEYNLNHDKFRIKAFYKQVNIKRLKAKTLPGYHPNVFFNVNTPEQLEEAERLICLEDNPLLFCN